VRTETIETDRRCRREPAFLPPENDVFFVTKAVAHANRCGPARCCGGSGTEANKRGFGGAARPATLTNIYLSIYPSVRPGV